LGAGEISPSIYPIKILADTREQAVLEFNHPYITEVVRTKLDFGDYSCEYSDNTRPPVIFERKNIYDLFSTLTSGHERFKREIIRAKTANHQLIIIIEGTMSDVLDGIKHSQVKGITIVRQLFTLYWRYGVQFVFSADRTEMANYIMECYFSIGRMKKKEPHEKD
jgi:ERCC4-type nuclease